MSAQGRGNCDLCGEEVRHNQRRYKVSLLTVCVWNREGRGPVFVILLTQYTHTHSHTTPAHMRDALRTAQQMPSGSYRHRSCDDAHRHIAHTHSEVAQSSSPPTSTTHTSTADSHAAPTGSVGTGEHVGEHKHALPPAKRHKEDATDHIDAPEGGSGDALGAEEARDGSVGEFGVYAHPGKAAPVKGNWRDVLYTYVRHDAADSHPKQVKAAWWRGVVCSAACGG